MLIREVFLVESAFREKSTRSAGAELDQGAFAPPRNVSATTAGSLFQIRLQPRFDPGENHETMKGRFVPFQTSIAQPIFSSPNCSAAPARRYPRRKLGMRSVENVPLQTPIRHSRMFEVFFSLHSEPLHDANRSGISSCRECNCFSQEKGSKGQIQNRCCSFRRMRNLEVLISAGYLIIPAVRWLMMKI